MYTIDLILYTDIILLASFLSVEAIKGASNLL